jgi:valyl-tRNA synthetase
VANVRFGGIMDPSDDFKYYYPTNDLVTGPDILFFWVARMIAGYEYTDKKAIYKCIFNWFGS